MKWVASAIPNWCYEPIKKISLVIAPGSTISSRMWHTQMHLGSASISNGISRQPFNSFKQLWVFRHRTDIYVRSKSWNEIKKEGV